MDIFACPACNGDLKADARRVECQSCKRTFGLKDGIPQLFWMGEWDSPDEDVTSNVKAFYEETPFPNYDGLENAADLMEKAQRGIFARLLNEQVPFNTRVLDVGCGTGQLSNYLGIAHRHLFGVDMCMNSLRLGHVFKEQNGLNRVGFYQMNLFWPPFKEESFPLVICNGVLHHTADPMKGFQAISRLVKKGGYLIIGLYNAYGRVANDLRRLLFKFTGRRFISLDPRLRKEGLGEAKKNAWFMDQYKHPHESKHTFGETMGWFETNGFEFINGIPKVSLFHSFTEKEKLFAKVPRGTSFDHFMIQAQMMLTGGREGGFFVMIGRRLP